MDTPSSQDSLSNLEPYSFPDPSSPSFAFSTFDDLQLNNLVKYSLGSPHRPYTPSAVYDLCGETSGLSCDRLNSNRLSHDGGSHSHSPGHIYESVPRSHRFNPISTPVTRSAVKARRKARNEDSDDDDDFQPAITTGNDVRRETIRHQRIESEQRRRDELRDGYRRLKDALPVSNQKSSKISLLDRATTHLKNLTRTTEQLQTRLQEVENEVQRLRTINEALMLGTAKQKHDAPAVAAVSQQSQSSF